MNSSTTFDVWSWVPGAEIDCKDPVDFWTLYYKKLDAPFTYQSGKVLETIVGAGTVPNQPGGMEVFYYTKEYGAVRWEGWGTNAEADPECMATSVMALDGDWESAVGTGENQKVCYGYRDLSFFMGFDPGSGTDWYDVRSWQSASDTPFTETAQDSYLAMNLLQDAVFNEAQSSDWTTQDCTINRISEPRQYRPGAKNFLMDLGANNGASCTFSQQADARFVMKNIGVHYEQGVWLASLRLRSDSLASTVRLHILQYDEAWNLLQEGIGPEISAGNVWQQHQFEDSIAPDTHFVEWRLSLATANGGIEIDEAFLVMSPDAN